MPEIEPLRAAVFGGSFDPVHEGHLEVARRAQAAFDLERILFVPAAQPPHKLDRELAPPHLRLAATMIATAHEPSWEVLATELGREGPSYTYDTLLEIPDLLRYRLVPKKDGGIAQRRRDLELFLIIGSDNLPGLPSWRNAEDIVAMAQPIVIWRGPDRESEKRPAGDPSVPAAGSDEEPAAGSDEETDETRAAEEGAASLLRTLEGRMSDASVERIRRGFLALPPHAMSSTHIRAALGRGEVPIGSVDDEVLGFLIEQSMYDWPEGAHNPFLPVVEVSEDSEPDVHDDEDDGFVDFEDEDSEEDGDGEASSASAMSPRAESPPEPGSAER